MATPEEARQTMINNLPEKTGKSLDEWLTILAEKSFEKHGEYMNFLKKENGVSHGFANLIAHIARGTTKPVNANNVSLLEAQYAGAKAQLRPIYDLLQKNISTFGNDVEFAEKKSYVSIRRTKQFAIIQPSTKTRVDVGLNLKHVDATDRLEKAGSFNSMVSHRVRLSDIADVNEELLNWIKTAYKNA